MSCYAVDMSHCMLLLCSPETFACKRITSNIAVCSNVPRRHLAGALTTTFSCRACAAASAAQSTLQGAVDGDVDGLSLRIASAEAAVREAESSADRAIEMEQEAARAAVMAQSHYKDAAAHQSASDRVCCSTLAV